MIHRAWRTTVRFLGSAPLALSLLVFVGAWSMAATMVPQGASSNREVSGWAAKHGAVEPLVQALGLHRAFTTPLFIACAALLAVSTAVCSWNRTRAALSRTRMLRAAATADQASIAGRHDLKIACNPALSGPEVLDITAETLEGLRLTTRHRDSVLSAVSPAWSVWGSPVFHWALLALMLAVFAGNLLRSEGSMPITVGQTKPDAPASYLSVAAGPWHDWARVHRSIRVDAFDPDYKVGGIDRGAVPTVSILNGAGKVLVTQLVYPNMKLHSGSLSINAPGVGLAPTLALLDSRGAEVDRVAPLVDFSQITSGGTVPLNAIVLRDSAGNAVMRISATVPLDRAGGHYGEWIPRQPAARVLVTSSGGTVLLDHLLRQGEEVALPGGGSIRLAGIGWYSRLSLVDDPTIPLIYAAMIVAALGLTMTLVFRQQLVLATYVEGPDGSILAMRLRLWRNTSTSRGEIESALARALQSHEKESMS